MNEHAAVLFANEAFYVAFSGADFEAMDNLWSASDSITCIHPGWDTLSGREEVMNSWRAIMSNIQELDIRCSHASAHVLGDTAYVLCYEQASNASLAATNVFILEDGHWKMVHHQAGPAPGVFDENDESEPPEIMQ